MNSTFVSYANGTQAWYSKENRDHLHREDGPAVKWESGDKDWWVNGERHREDGPAIEFTNGEKEWWLNNIRYDPIEWLLKLHEMNK